MSAAQPESGLESERQFIVDALNVAYWCGRTPMLRLPLALLVHLLDAGRQARLYFDASARYRFGHEAELYQRLLEQHPEQLIEVPSGKTADGVLLRQARASGACILSRDRYRDHRRRYRRLIDDPTRLISGWVHDERMLLPALGLDFVLPPSAEEAAARWQTLPAVASA